VIYVGSAEDQSLDQELDAVLLPASNTGRFKFVLQVPAPDAACIPPADILGVTIVLLTCSYRSHEFIRVGYYVNNEHPDHAPVPDDAQGEDAELTVADDGDAADDEDGDAADDDDVDDDAIMDVESNGDGSSSAGPPAPSKPEKPPVETPAASAKGKLPPKSAAGATPVITKMPDLSRITRVISSEPTVTRFTLKHWDEPSSGTVVDPELSGDVMQQSNIPVP
jgi:ASF1 like histone chaperone